MFISRGTKKLEIQKLQNCKWSFIVLNKKNSEIHFLKTLYILNATVNNLIAERKYFFDFRDV